MSYIPYEDKSGWFSHRVYFLPKNNQFKDETDVANYLSHNDRKAEAFGTSIKVYSKLLGWILSKIGFAKHTALNIDTEGKIHWVYTNTESLKKEIDRLSNTSANLFLDDMKMMYDNHKAEPYDKQSLEKIENALITRLENAEKSLNARKPNDPIDNNFLLPNIIDSVLVTLKGVTKTQDMVIKLKDLSQKYPLSTPGDNIQNNGQIVNPPAIKEPTVDAPKKKVPKESVLIREFYKLSNVIGVSKELELYADKNTGKWLNESNKKDSTLIYYLVLSFNSGSCYLSENAKNEWNEILKDLIEEGFDPYKAPNYKDYGDPLSALHAAISPGSGLNTERILILLNAWKDDETHSWIELTNTFFTMLERTDIFYMRDFETQKQLIDAFMAKGARLRRQLAGLNSALHIVAKRFSSNGELLFKYIALKAPDQLRDGNLLDGSKNTPLHYFASACKSPLSIKEFILPDTITSYSFPGETENLLINKNGETPEDIFRKNNYSKKLNEIMKEQDPNYQPKPIVSKSDTITLSQRTITVAPPTSPAKPLLVVGTINDEPEEPNIEVSPTDIDVEISKLTTLEDVKKKYESLLKMVSDFTKQPLEDDLLINDIVSFLGQDNKQTLSTWIEMIVEFKEQGISINKGKEYGDSPLKRAVESSYIHPELVITLLNNKAKPSFGVLFDLIKSRTYEKWDKETKLKVLQVFIDQKCMLQSNVSGQSNALHIAADNGDKDTFEFLARYEPRLLGSWDSLKLTPLAIAKNKNFPKALIKKLERMQRTNVTKFPETRPAVKEFGQLEAELATVEKEGKTVGDFYMDNFHDLWLYANDAKCLRKDLKIRCLIFLANRENVDKDKILNLFDEATADELENENQKIADKYFNFNNLGFHYSNGNIRRHGYLGGDLEEKLKQLMAEYSIDLEPKPATNAGQVKISSEDEISSNTILSKKQNFLLVQNILYARNLNPSLETLVVTKNVEQISKLPLIAEIVEYISLNSATIARTDVDEFCKIITALMNAGFPVDLPVERSKLAKKIPVLELLNSTVYFPQLMLVLVSKSNIVELTTVLHELVKNRKFYHDTTISHKSRQFLVINLLSKGALVEFEKRNILHIIGSPYKPWVYNPSITEANTIRYNIVSLFTFFADMHPQLLDKKNAENRTPYEEVSLIDGVKGQLKKYAPVSELPK